MPIPATAAIATPSRAWEAILKMAAPILRAALPHGESALEKRAAPIALCFLSPIAAALRRMLATIKAKPGDVPTRRLVGLSLLSASTDMVVVEFLQDVEPFYFVLD